MNMGTVVFGITIYDHAMWLLELAILIVIIMEGDFFKRKKKQYEKAWRKFIRDSKRYFKPEDRT
jgi:hypothetical protein